MSEKLKMLFDIFEKFEQAGMIDDEVAALLNGQYCGVTSLNELVDVMEDELSYIAEDSE